MVIVDTSAWVEFFRRDGNPSIKLALEKDYSIFAHDKHFHIMRQIPGVILYQPGHNGMFNPEFE